MKTVPAQGKYVVSFNTSFYQYDCGEDRMNSLDYAGDDIDDLATEVMDDDRDYPMTFKRLVDDPHVVGIFLDGRDNDEDCPVAIMANREYW